MASTVSFQVPDELDAVMRMAPGHPDPSAPITMDNRASFLLGILVRAFHESGDGVIAERLLMVNQRLFGMTDGH